MPPTPSASRSPRSAARPRCPAPTAPCAGHAVRDLTLPKDVALVVIVRGTRVITPTPEEPLETGDELLFVALPEAEAAIRRAIIG